VFLGIYWNNHHHLLQAARQVNGRILWANMHLLFWLTLIPFATSWMGENHTAAWPVAVYGLVLIGAGGAYSILTRVLIAHHGTDSVLATAVGCDSKGNLSVAIYAVAIVLAFFSTFLACLLYVAVAILWLIPDARIEGLLAERGDR
jgi:uncharacterized membrane protein